MGIDGSANPVLTDLVRLHAELEEIMAAGDRLKFRRGAEVARYSDRLRAIKAELKEAAKTGTWDRRRRPPNDWESAFYSHSVTAASAHFRMRVDAPPEKWVGGLYEPAADLSYAIHQLKHALADSQKA